MSNDNAALTFSRAAYEKWRWLTHYPDIEVSAMGITAADNPLYVEDLALMEQEGSTGSTDPTEEGLAELVERFGQMDIYPNRCFRIWCHTHPEMGADPSGTDRETFNKEFGACNYAYMCIMSKTNAVSAHVRTALQIPGSDVTIAMYRQTSVMVDWSCQRPVNPELWLEEFNKYVKKRRPHYGGYANWHERQEQNLFPPSKPETRSEVGKAKKKTATRVVGGGSDGKDDDDARRRSEGLNNTIPLRLASIAQNYDVSVDVVRRAIVIMANARGLSVDEHDSLYAAIRFVEQGEMVELGKDAIDVALEELKDNNQEILVP